MRRPIRHEPRGLAFETRPKASPVIVTRIAPTATAGDVVMTFGKYEGYSIAEIHDLAPSYVRWLAAQHQLPKADQSVNERLLRMSEHAARFLSGVCAPAKDAEAQRANSS